MHAHKKIRKLLPGAGVVVTVVNGAVTGTGTVTGAGSETGAGIGARTGDGIGSPEE